MKEKLQKILDEINSFTSYSDENTKRFISLIKEALGIIELLDTTNNISLSSWAEMAQKELQGELDNRVNSSFFQLDEGKKKSDFTFSKSTVSMSITYILMNL